MYKIDRSFELCKCPFEIRCNACGSHNVTISGKYGENIKIECQKCGSLLYDVQEYNENNFFND